MTITAILVIGAGVVRYAQMPSFWLDEAFVAVSIRNPSVKAIFARLEYGQFFPRLYLAAIAAIRHFTGYQIWAVRLLPFVFFVVATVLWARLLFMHSRHRLVVTMLAASFLLGSILWLDQAIQLKQYTLDVLIALIPFLLADETFEGLGQHSQQWLILGLSVPCLFSYTYPVALTARLLGWYAIEAKRRKSRLNSAPFTLLVVSVSAALATLWLTDLRFNAQDMQAYSAYWSDCILKSSFQQSIESGLRLVARFLWGWHGREPIVTAIAVPLQGLGLWSIIQRFKAAGRGSSKDGFDARLLGSCVLLSALLIASAIGLYPICAGRITLFAQVHIQLITIEGAAFILRRWPASRLGLAMTVVAVVAVSIHSVRDYARFASSEPAENIKAMIKFIDPGTADRLWVHPCSIAQVRSLPDRLPVSELLFGDSKQETSSAVKSGARVWILWTHLGTKDCVDQLDMIRAHAKSWRVVDEGAARGLVLAEF